jgi:transcriptional regulator with XRE-family HTH domain
MHKKFLAELVGKKIRAIRLQKGATIEQIACDAGIEYTQLSRIERGCINTSIYQLYIISKALEVEISNLLKSIEADEVDKSQDILKLS